VGGVTAYFVKQFLVSLHIQGGPKKQAIKIIKKMCYIVLKSAIEIRLLRQTK